MSAMSDALAMTMRISAMILLIVVEVTMFIVFFDANRSVFLI